jgi:hypothetical protein
MKSTSSIASNAFPLATFFSSLEEAKAEFEALTDIFGPHLRHQILHNNTRTVGVFYMTGTYIEQNDVHRMLIQHDEVSITSTESARLANQFSNRKAVDRLPNPQDPTRVAYILVNSEELPTNAPVSFDNEIIGFTPDHGIQAICNDIYRFTPPANHSMSSFYVRTASYGEDYTALAKEWARLFPSAYVYILFHDVNLVPFRCHA